MMKHYDQVVEFMKTFGQDVHTTPVAPTTRVANLRIELIREELEDELVPAINTDDIVEIADALTDILYVAYGAHAAFGTLPSESGKYVNPVDLTRSVRAPTVFEANNAVDMMRDGVYKLGSLFSENQAYGFESIAPDALDTIIASAYRLAWQCGIDIFKCFEEVHSSNMSKVCKTRIEAENSIQWRIDNAASSDVVANYTGAYVEEVNGFFVIKRRMDGKGLKGRNYFDPNLKDILGM